MRVYLSLCCFSRIFSYSPSLSCLSCQAGCSCLSACHGTRWHWHVGESSSSSSVDKGCRSLTDNYVWRWKKEQHNNWHPAPLCPSAGAARIHGTKQHPGNTGAGLKITCQWAERLGRLQSASLLWLCCSARHTHVGFSWCIFIHTFKCPEVCYEVMLYILHWSLLDVKSALPDSRGSGQAPVPESCRDAPVLSNNRARRANVVCLMSSKITRHTEKYAREMLGFAMIIFSWQSHWTFIFVHV